MASWLIEQSFQAKFYLIAPEDSGTITINYNIINLHGNPKYFEYYNRELEKFKQQWAYYHKHQNQQQTASAGGI